MPAYNAEKTIKISIDSILAQTFEDWELIVVNDASTDKTVDYIPNDPRINIVTNEKNSGVSKSRNVGIELAKGEYLAFLDSDDLWRADKLEKQLQFMKENDALISYTASAFINRAGEASQYVMEAEKTLCYDDLLKRNLMSLSSVMIRRDLMIPFPLTEMIHEDYVVWLKLLKEHGLAYGLNEPLLIYRMGEATKSSNRLTSAKMTYNAYRYVGYGVCSACFLTMRYATHSIKKRMKI